MDAGFFTELSQAARAAIAAASRNPENKAGGGDYDPAAEGGDAGKEGWESAAEDPGAKRN